MKILFTLAVLVGISSALQFAQDIPFVGNATTQIFDQLTGTLYSKSLSQLNETKKIVIQNSKLDRIEDGALCSSPFEEIEIRQSELPPFTAAMFGTTCPSLKKLTYINPFKARGEDEIETLMFADDVFRSLENVEEISAFYSGQLDSVPNMKNLTKLKKVQFAYCDIERMDPEDAFDGTTNVEELDLRGSNIQELDGEFLRNFGKLKKLNVAGSKDLIDFPWDDLWRLPNLEELLMNSTSVDRVDAGKLVQFCPKLKLFNFQGIDISCDTASEVTKNIHEKKPKVDIPKFTCEPEL